jgi:acyl dehydratase
MKPLHLHGEELAVGSAAPEWRWGPVSLTDIVRYAGASGDFTPLHHDPAVAAGLGLDRVFAMGMMSAGLAGHYVADWVGLSRVRRLGIRFRDKTWQGDTLVFRGIVLTSHRTSEAGFATEISVQAESGDGRVILALTASAEIPSRAACGRCAPEAARPAPAGLPASQPPST